MVSAKYDLSCVLCALSCSLEQVKFSLDKYIMAIYLSMGKYKNFYFHTHV